MIRFAFFLLLSAYAGPSLAQNAPPMSGDYVCSYGCRLTDANPSVAIEGDRADCMNELGGIFRGRVLSETSISCFNKTGVLARDGVTLQWSDGVVWKRHLGPSQ
jgi:hypothetical protein